MAKNWIIDFFKKDLIPKNTEEKDKYIFFNGEKIRSMKNKLKTADSVENNPKTS